MRVAIADVTSMLGRYFYDALRLEEISINRLAPDAANRIRRSQIRGAIKQMRVFLAGNTVFAPVMSFQAWDKGINALVVMWTIAMLCFSWWLFFQWNKSYNTDGAEGDMAGFVAETKINSGLWCLGLIAFYPIVSGDNKTILVIVMTGSLALGTVGFSQAPRAAVWYLGIQTAVLTLVPFACGIYWNTPADLVISGLALTAGISIFNAVLERARSQMRAFVNHESLAQKTEVIDLLLQDYEEQGVEWVWRTDASGRVLSCPQQVLDLITDTGEISDDMTMQASLAKYIDPEGEAELAKVTASFATNGEFHEATLPFYSKSRKSLRWIMMRGRPQFEGRDFVGFRGIFADATTAVEAQRQFEYLAENDPLTGIYNRNYIQTRLDGVDAGTDRLMAFLIDLDGFKQVNDSYGHAIGDKLLQLVAQRLSDTIGDSGIVARLGGDEFLILTEAFQILEGLDENALSNRILTQLSEPFLIDRYDISLSASIGTAIFPRDTCHGPTLLNQADLALYVAKKGGRNRCVAFVQSMQAGLQKRMVVTDRLRQAVQDNMIVPYYQPQYCARTLKLVGFEALARWTDQELGVVGPDIFIPIAEETGMIHEIGESLLRQACCDALTWPAQDGQRPLKVSVNVSPVQVMRGDVVQRVASVLDETGLPPEQLEIEVTEGVLIDDTVGTRSVLIDLSRLGVSIALDDFGTGYSSLSYLRALPLHSLKIDRSFIADIESADAKSVVQTIIDLCRRLDLEVIAEGVENAENVAMLRDMRCDVLQGYYFSRPVSASEIPSLLARAKASAA